SPMHARARTAATRSLVCCGNRYSVVLPDTRMSMTPSACGTIQRCAGSSAAKPSWAVQLRRARLAALNAMACYRQEPFCSCRLVRPVDFSYQVGSWTKPRRVIAKVEWHSGELYPRVGFIVTNMRRPAERVGAFYNKRGTCEQWINMAH